MKRLLLAVTLIAAPLSAQVATERDSTIYTATRIRTTLSGRILSVTVSKIAALPTGRVDTVRVPSPVQTVTLRDTVWFSPNTNQAGDSVLWYGPLPWVTFPGSPQRPGDFALPKITVRVTDTLNTANYWRPNIIASSVNPGGLRVVYGTATTLGTKPANVELPNVGTSRVDTVAFIPFTEGPPKDTILFAMVSWSGQNKPPVVVYPVRVRVDTLTIPSVCPICPTVPPASGELVIRARSPYLTDVFAGGVHLGYVGESSTKWVAWRRLSFTPDSIQMDRLVYDTQAIAVDALTKPYNGPTYPVPVMPELPRVYLDTRMPPSPAPGGVIITVP